MLTLGVLVHIWGRNAMSRSESGLIILKKGVHVWMWSKQKISHLFAFLTEECHLIILGKGPKVLGFLSNRVFKGIKHNSHLVKEALWKKRQSGQSVGKLQLLRTQGWYCVCLDLHGIAGQVSHLWSPCDCLVNCPTRWFLLLVSII